MNFQITNPEDTIIARATPAGEGAIGIVRLSGKDSFSMVNSVFQAKNLNEQPSHTIHFGTVINDSGNVIDEVLVSLFKAPNSYTGEDVVEISCHGSEYIIQQILQLFIDKGVRMAQPGEFTMRAFLNGKMDLSQAEAVADLIASDSKTSHDIAINQMRGGFSGKLQNLRQKLMDFASLVELELDFGEEDVEFADRKELKKNIEDIQKFIGELTDSFRLGNVLKNGVSTVIAGRPNAGKSTLLNVLLNEERAIVSEIPGTTRDTIEEVLNINGLQFRLIDTAGIREAHDKIEKIGVEKTLLKIRQSALLVYIFDLPKLSEKEVSEDLKKIVTKDVPVLVVANKADISKKESFKLDGYKVIMISAKKKDNIKNLKQNLYDLVIAGKLNTTGTIITNARHYEALTKAKESLTEVLRGLDTGISGDFLAMDIRRALMFLGEITGEITTDDLLGNIFGKFCIGK